MITYRKFIYFSLTFVTILFVGNTVLPKSGCRLKQKDISLETTLEQKEFRVRPDVCRNCFTVPYKYIMSSPGICGWNSQIDLIILISSQCYERSRREIMRRTWLSQSRNNTSQRFRYAFLVGCSEMNCVHFLRQENDIHHDIVVQNFNDTYRNLTIKTIMGITWFSKFCSMAKFVMKTDDDVYINVTNILSLTTKAELQDKIFGYCRRFKKVHRGNRKFSARLWEYPHKEYPGLCFGLGYVMSAEIARGILRVSRHVPFFFLEDVYIGLCIHRLGYKLKDIKGFSLDPLPYRRGKCGVYGNNDVYSIHGLSLQDILELWKHCQ